jgi:hypothetical protein
MRKVFIFSILFSIASLGYAQKKQFSIDDKVMSVGLGMGSVYGSGFKTKIPPISVSYETGFKQNIFSDKDVLTLGGFAGITTYGWEYTYGSTTWGYNYTHFIVGARSAVHYPFIDNLDTYGGLMLGLNLVLTSEYGTSITSTSSPYSYNPLALGGYLGARYYFAKDFAAFAEIGYGISYLTLGLAKKL